MGELVQVWEHWQELLQVLLLEEELRAWLEEGERGERVEREERVEKKVQRVRERGERVEKRGVREREERVEKRERKVKEREGVKQNYVLNEIDSQLKIFILKC